MAFDELDLSQNGFVRITAPDDNSIYHSDEISRWAYNAPLQADFSNIGITFRELEDSLKKLFYEFIEEEVVSECELEWEDLL